MTTKTITPAEVTLEMLIAGVESNETATNLPSRYQVINGELRYSVKFTVGNWLLPASNEWEWVSSTALNATILSDVRDWMEGETYDDTIWTTTVEQETDHD